jgi:hypothetical protein
MDTLNSTQSGPSPPQPNRSKFGRIPERPLWVCNGDKQALVLEIVGGR